MIVLDKILAIFNYSINFTNAEIQELVIGLNLPVHRLKNGIFLAWSLGVPAVKEIRENE